jgi:hypothetical protein
MKKPQLKLIKADTQNQLSKKTQKLQAIVFN